MTTLREAAQQALEALESDPVPLNAINNACAFLRAALAEPVQEPEGYFSVNDYGRWEENESEYGTPLYAAPPQRDALLEALRGYVNDYMSEDGLYDAKHYTKTFSAAIKAAEENT